MPPTLLPDRFPQFGHVQFSHQHPLVGTVACRLDIDRQSATAARRASTGRRPAPPAGPGSRRCTPEPTPALLGGSPRRPATGTCRAILSSRLAARLSPNGWDIKDLTQTNTLTRPRIAWLRGAYRLGRGKCHDGGRSGMRSIHRRARSLVRSQSAVVSTTGFTIQPFQRCDLLVSTRPATQTPRTEFHGNWITD